jgi:hypothetical protein
MLKFQHLRLVGGPILAHPHQPYYLLIIQTYNEKTIGLRRKLILPVWLKQTMDLQQSMAINMMSDFYVSGCKDAGALINLVPPSNEKVIIHEDDEFETLPPIDACFTITLKTRSIKFALTHPCVIDQLCYTSNLHDMRDLYGRETLAQCIALEKARILATSSGAVYVQLRHLQLIADIMTSEVVITPMTTHGLVKRKRTDFLTRLAFEKIHENTLKSAQFGQYDSMNHVTPNLMFGNMLPFTGSGICHAIPKLALTSQPDDKTQKSSNQSSNLPLSINQQHVMDYDTVNADEGRAQQLDALINFMLASCES